MASAYLLSKSSFSGGLWCFHSCLLEVVVDFTDFVLPLSQCRQLRLFSLADVFDVLVHQQFSLNQDISNLCFGFAQCCTMALIDFPFSHLRNGLLLSSSQLFALHAGLSFYDQMQSSQAKPQASTKGRSSNEKHLSVTQYFWSLETLVELKNGLIF